MKNKSLLTRLICVFVVLFVAFITIGASSFIAKWSDKASDSDGVIDNGDTVTLSFKYAVCEDITETVYEKEAISGYENITISDKTTYESFFSFISGIASGVPISNTTIPAGTYTYEGTGNYSGTFIILDVSSQIKHTEADSCSGTSESYEGTYTISSKKNTSRVKSYNYYGNSIKETINVKKNKTVTANDLNELFSLSNDDSYKFVGLAEENSDGTPSENAVSLPINAAGTKTYYAIFNKSEMASTTTYHLGKTISGYTTGEYTFNEYIGSTDEFNLTKDSSYFEKDNVIFLGDKTSTITTEDGETLVGTKIASGVAINFGLNSGDVTIAGTHAAVHDLEPEDSKHTNQYTIFLQSDLYVYGTLVIGANYGTTQNTNYEGHIADEYVTIDLNGHNIYVKGGTLNVYGLIKNSKDTGEVISYGGYIYTLAVIYDYRGGSATSSLVTNTIMPFQVYNLPYFRCKARLYYSSKGWTQFIARCQAQTTSITASEILINFLGGADDTVLFKLSQQDDSYVEIEGTENKQITDGKTATSNEVIFCLSRRLKISFYNCDAKMSNIVINPGATVDTVNFNFPVSSFFDIFLINTDMTFSQSLKIMPGASLIADKNSNVIMSFDSTNKKSAQISVLGDSAYYYDSEKTTIVKNDLIAEDQFVYQKTFFQSETLWKYYSGNRVKIYGTLVFKGGNSSIREYLLAGAIDFNRVAYSSDGTTTNLVPVSYEENENPFAKLMQEHSDLKIITYGYDYMVGNHNRNGIIKGYSRPLVSYGKGYYTNGSADSAKVGDYSFRTGIFKVSESEMYYFNIGTTFSLADNSTCTLQACTYDETEHTFTDTSTSIKYAYFASSYYPYTNTDGAITLNVTRSNSSTTSVTVVYNPTLERWLRK